MPEIPESSKSLLRVRESAEGRSNLYGVVLFVWVIFYFLSERPLEKRLYKTELSDVAGLIMAPPGERNLPPAAASSQLGGAPRSNNVELWLSAIITTIIGADCHPPLYSANDSRLEDA